MAENLICSECTAAATHICMCKKPRKLYFCQTCCSKHVFKGGAGHSIIPVEAGMLVSSAEDIDVYNSRLEATYQLSASLDSLSQQAQKEREELQSLAWKVYEERKEELYQAYTVLWQELQAKYDQILHELTTIKTEVNNSASRLESSLSPITITFLESFLHIQPHALINCVAELSSRITLAVIPEACTLTPLEEILAQWHCKKCEKCVSMKEKFMMKKSVSGEDALHTREEVRRASEHLQEQGSKEQISPEKLKGQASQKLFPQGQVPQGQIPQGQISQEQMLPKQPPSGDAPHKDASQTEPSIDARWTCAICQLNNVPENAICWRCKVPRDADVSQCAQVTNSHYRGNSGLMELEPLTTVYDVLKRDPTATWKCPRGCGAMNPMTQSRCRCGYVDLNLVESGSFAAEIPPTDSKAVQQSENAPVIPNPCWTCGHCNYEYNMKEADVCIKCENPNPDRSSANPQKSAIWASKPQTGATEEKKVIVQEIDPNAPVWPCANCGYEYNLKDTPSCLKCQTKNPLKLKQEAEKQSSLTWTCQKCNRQQTGVRLDTCNQCQASSSRQTELKKNYWECVSCGTHYNQIGYACNSCGKYQGQVHESQSVGTWKCPDCQSEHPASTSQCSRCHPSDATPPQAALSWGHPNTEPLSQGQETRAKWICRNCKRTNDLASPKCDVCGDNRPTTLMCSKCHQALIEVNGLCRACAIERNIEERKANSASQVSRVTKSSFCIICRKLDCGTNHSRKSNHKRRDY